MQSLTLTRMKKNYFSLFLFHEKEEVAYLYFFINKSKKYVIFENIYSKYSGQRLGTYLMLQVCKFILYRFPQIRWVKLDDCSGILPPRNIYFKLGFQVKDEKRKNLYCSWDLWLKKYDLPNPSEERRILLSTLFSNLKNFLKM